MLQRTTRRLLVAVVAGVALAGCATLQPPIPANTFVSPDQNETFRIVMRALSSQNYRVVDSDAAGGFVRAVQEDLLYTRELTVTTVGEGGGTAVKVTPRSSRSSDDATTAARALVNEINRLAQAADS